MRDLSIRVLLRVDAAVGAAMGVALAVAAEPMGGLTGLPPGLLRGAGLALAPIAAFMAIVAARPSAGLVGVIVWGNVAWALGSVLLLVSGWIAPNALGTGFVLAQAAVVAGFAAVERAAAVAREA